MRDDAAPTSQVSPTSIGARLRRPVALVGLMGSGKSTIGRRLADALGRSFVDADDAIAEAAGMPVADIFERFGEAHFRDGERRVIARLIGEGHGVIATGGGAFAQDATRAALLEGAVCVWLDCPVAVLAERTGRRDTRPLLRGGDPVATLERLAAEREPFYAEAPLRVEVGEGSHEATVDAVFQALARWG